MGGADLGATLLRLSLGPMLITHGWNKVAGPGGLEGTARWFAGLGLVPGRLHARAAAANELLAGTLVTVGLLLPLAGAAYVALMLVAAFTDHRGKGFFVFRGGSEYVLVVAVAAVALVAVGPGPLSVDAVLGTSRQGAGWAAASALAGIAGCAGFLTAFRPATRLRAKAQAGGEAPGGA